MVQRKQAKGVRKSSPKRRRTPKTYVFPYKGLDPVVQVKNGIPIISGSSGNGDLPAVSDAGMRQVVEQIRQMIAQMQNAPEHDQILRAIEAASERLEANVTQALQRMVRERVDALEEELVTRIQNFENVIARPRGENAVNIRQEIIELQGMEREIIDSVNALRPLLSQEIVRQTDRLSVQLDQHLVALDNLKREVKQTIVDESRTSRTQIMNEIELLQRNSVDSARMQELLRMNTEESNRELSMIVQQMIDRLGSSSREDVQNIRNMIQQNQDFRQAEQDVMKRLLEDLKTDLRSQIDVILRTLSTIPTERSTESPVFIQSQQRVGELEAELRNMRSQLTAVQRSLETQVEQTRTLEDELAQRQILIERLQRDSSDSADLRQTIQRMREDEMATRTQLDRDCISKLDDLRARLNEQYDARLQESTDLLRENLGSRIRELEGELSNVRSQTRDLQASLDTEVSRIQGLEADISTKQAIITDLENGRVELSSEIRRSLEDQIRDLQAQVSSSNGSLETLRNELESSRVRIQELEREVERRQSIITDLQAESRDTGYLQQTIETLRQEEEEKLRRLEDDLTRKRIDDLRNLEARLISNRDAELQDLKSVLDRRIQDLEAQNEMSQTYLAEEKEKSQNLKNELRRANETNLLLQASQGEAEALKRAIENIERAEVERLEELEKSLTERYTEELNVLSAELAKEKSNVLTEKRASQLAQELLQSQIDDLQGKLSTEQARSRDLEVSKNEFETKTRELEDILREQEEENEQLRKVYSGERSGLEKTIVDLRTQLDQEKQKGVSGQEENQSRIQELERLLKQCDDESKRQNDMVKNSLSKIEEMERDLIIMRDNLSKTSTALEETLREMEKFEAVQADTDELLQTIRDQMSLLDSIQKRVVEILKGGNQKFGDNVEENVITLAKYVEKIQDMRSNLTEALPRYAILIDVAGTLELIDTFVDSKVEFGNEAVQMKSRMYEYSAEVYEMYEQIRRYIYDTELVHIVQGRVLTQLKQGIVEPPTDLSGLVPLVITEGSKRKFQILVDVFSPIIPTSATSNNNISITSALMRAFNYRDAIELTVGIIPDQGLRDMMSTLFRQILLSYGKEIPNVSQRLYDVQDMFSIQMMLIDEMRSYLAKSKFYTKDFVYGLEARLVMFDSFIKAFLETKTALQSYRTSFKTKVSGREMPDKRMISYVRVRADNNVIDPRYSILVNGDSKDKMQISHQPFVVSSLSLNDAETPYFQHDMYGPFSRVFLPNESNRDIAKQLTDLVSSLNSNKDVCTLALGPSGSGKTSTLLYFRGSESSPIPSQGIIPLMLNQLDPRFTMARVTAFEFAANYESKSTNDYWKKYSVFETPVTFVRGEYEWVSDGPVTMENFSYDSSRTICEVPTPFSGLVRTQSRLGEVSIGSFVAKLTDTRLNCGTPNNPVSSRTHLFLFIKLMRNRNDTRGPTLTVADLAGREKTFDCNSEAVLENLALNKYYPTLNNLLNNPLGAAKESPIVEVQVGEKFSPANTIVRLRSTDSLFAKEDISKVPLKKLMTELSLHTFFDLVDKAGEKSTTFGYVREMMGKVGSEKSDISNRFYSAMRRLFKRIIADGYMSQLLTRLENLEKQPLELRNLLEQLDDVALLAGIEKVVAYFASDKIITGINYTEQPQRKRLGREVGNQDILSRVLKLMPVYLNSILLIEYMNNVLKKAPVKVCGYRNIEGEFINRSLDELANLVLIASSFSEDNGPAVHPECLPVSCTFAGLDCLLPKNVPKEMPRSAIADILAEGMGKPSFDVMNTVFCTFVVINISKNLAEGKLFRPIYDPAETMIKEATLAFGKMKRDMQFYLADPNRPVGESSAMFNQAYDVFSKTYSSEMQLQTDFRNRLEYRGMDLNKMMTEEFRLRSYQSSVEHWETMRNAIDIIMNTLTDKELVKMGAQKILELDEVMRKLEQLGEVIRVKNQDTAIGVLMFADDIVKRGLQPMVCTSVNSREEILSTTVGWSNVQLSI